MMPARKTLAVGATLLAALSLSACRQDMHDQPKYEPYEASRFFADGRTARPMIEGTVARGFLREDDALYRGLDANGQFVTDLPVWLEPALLERGQERYEIYCSVCHGRTGDGQGMIVQRGFHRPESFHQARLREMPIGYFFDVMTNGFGQMSSYASQVKVEDRWAIAAYVRALQASRYVDAATLTTEDRDAVERGVRLRPEPPATGHGGGHGAGHGSNDHGDGHAAPVGDGGHAEEAHDEENHGDEGAPTGH